MINFDYCFIIKVIIIIVTFILFAFIFEHFLLKISAEFQIIKLIVFL